MTSRVDSVRSLHISSKSEMCGDGDEDAEKLFTRLKFASWGDKRLRNSHVIATTSSLAKVNRQESETKSIVLSYPVLLSNEILQIPRILTELIPISMNASSSQNMSNAYACSRSLR